MPWDFLLIFLVLAVVLPWRGYLRMKDLLTQPSTTSRQRLFLYASTILFQWMLAGAVFWRARARGMTFNEMGISARSGLAIVAGTLLGAVLFAVFHWANLRRIGRADAARVGRLRAVGERIFPQSRKELAVYVILALTAGFCEEFLYRGFSMAAFWRVGIPSWVVVLASAALFGLAHSYQGKSGILGTLVLGTVFALARIGYDSLVPVVVWHATIDVAAGIAGPKYVLGRDRREIPI
jgi:membrane protease YdiL (CAAX protease family)